LNILFVCNANRCRSAMAEAIFRQMVRDIRRPKIEVKSAGTILRYDSVPASENAIAVMRERGLDISSHRTQSVDNELIDWADLILTMTDHQKQYIDINFVRGREKVHLITEYAGMGGDIPDPILAELDEYRECVDQLEDVLRKLKPKIIR
jgi:protein-tyrosine-phosphatase